MNNNSAPVTEVELKAFVEAVSSRHNSGLRLAYPTCDLNWETVDALPGKKYARLVTVRNGQRSSAMGFVNLENGDILKADGWKAPAKHARGNIRVGTAENLWNGAFTNNGGALCVAYLR